MGAKSRKDEFARMWSKGNPLDANESLPLIEASSPMACGPRKEGLGEGLAEKVGKGLAKGWRRVGEGLAEGWRRVAKR